MRFAVSFLLVLVTLAGCQPATPTAPAPTTSDATAIPAPGTPVATPAAGDPFTTATPAAASTASASSTVTPTLELPTAGGHNHLTREQLEAGWLRLFDGYTLFGWQPNSETQWSVVDGVIVCEDTKPGLLVSSSRWADYELLVDFRVAAGGNSGVFLRTPLNPKSPVTDCYELNVCDSHPEFKSASLVGRQQPLQEVAANGDWHTFHVTVQGPQVTVKLDGTEVLQYTDATAAPLKIGHIGLQMNGGKAEFRNVYLKPLSLTNLFNAETLTGWRMVPGSKGEFKVADSTIEVTGGRGFLETERTAGNFVLQFEAITHGEALNSGVFFRAEPGTETNPSDGYEFQIQNGTKGGDRNAPADHGTGAIFRRVSARRVVANDNAWLTATLVADGPHFCTWVDGIQVVDWTDEREPNNNPRQGLRLSPGHLSLQAHDPTTNLQFRKLQLFELP